MAFFTAFFDFPMMLFGKRGCVYPSQEIGSVHGSHQIEGEGCHVHHRILIPRNRIIGSLKLGLELCENQFLGGVVQIFEVVFRLKRHRYLPKKNYIP
jgi:hypothetical protein